LSRKTSWMFGLGYANAVSLFIRVLFCLGEYILRL
jgi:hypothetical protein